MRGELSPGTRVSFNHRSGRERDVILPLPPSYSSPPFLPFPCFLFSLLFYSFSSLYLTFPFPFPFLCLSLSFLPSPPLRNFLPFSLSLSHFPSFLSSPFLPTFSYFPPPPLTRPCACYHPPVNPMFPVCQDNNNTKVMNSLIWN